MNYTLNLFVNYLIYLDFELAIFSITGLINFMRRHCFSFSYYKKIKHNFRVIEERYKKN